MSQHERKILPVLKIIRVCLTTRQTTAGAPIDDLTVASSATFMFRKSHKTTPPNSVQNICSDAKTELEVFYPQWQYEGSDIIKFRQINPIRMINALK